MKSSMRCCSSLIVIAVISCVITRIVRSKYELISLSSYPSFFLLLKDYHYYHDSTTVNEDEIDTLRNNNDDNNDKHFYNDHDFQYATSYDDGNTNNYNDIKGRKLQNIDTAVNRAPKLENVDVAVGPMADAAVLDKGTIFINCGSNTDFVDANGIRWVADVHYRGGTAMNSSSTAIENELYRSYRATGRASWVPFSRKAKFFDYKIPVYNTTKQYTIFLYFYEASFIKTGKRDIDVWIEDTLIVNNLDIIEESIQQNVDGKSIPLVVRSTAMTIIDGEINVRVVGAPWPGNSGLLSAISIQATDSFQPILIKAGGGTYTDSRGRVWVSDAPFVTGGSYFAPSGAMPTISETLDQGLYTSERFGDFKYDIPKLNAASYAITFHFAELYFWASDQRVFDIYVEGNLATKNVDIIQLGYGTKNRAITIEWLQVVSDGVLTIEFKSVGKNSPKLSAIEINYRLPHLAHAVSNGPYQVVDTRNVKKRKVHVDGTSSHTHKQGISLKDFMWKEGSKLLGRGAEADFDLSVGNHTVTLYVRDSDGNDAADSTTVSVLPFGNANVDSLVPNKGGLQGGSQVTIKGSGFGYPASSIVVNFGDYKLTNTQVQVIDKKTLVVAAPPNPNGVPVPVSVTTPLGSSNKIPYTYVDGLSISFESGKIADLYGPACGTFGPDGRLYVGTSNGRVVRYTLDSEYKKVVAYVESSVIWQKHGFKDRAILGIAFDPLDTQENPTVYVSHNFFFHGESKSSSFDAINGKVSTLSGANLDVYTDIITGLPVSDHDHGVNGLEFGDFGELYIQIGGNTNAGVPGELSGSRSQKENVLSSATLVAKLSSPSFDGFVKYHKDDDGNMVGGFGVEVFAAGQRNPFDIVLHSNGYMYATDNGMNMFYGDVSVGCNPDTDNLPEYNELDKVNLVKKGSWYGHPNRMRGKSDPRQCKFRAAAESSDKDYTAPIMTGKSSLVGIIEFQSNHFDGQMRGNLIVAGYTDGLYRLVLSRDGLKAQTSLIPLAGTDSLDVTQAPDGTLVHIAYSTMTIWYHRPKQATTADLNILSVYPRRGGRAGGNALSIYGVNLSNGGTPTVTVGGRNCPVKSSSASKIVCTLPGGSGTVDVTVSASSTKRYTYVAGYRYVKGVP